MPKDIGSYRDRNLLSRRMKPKDIPSYTKKSMANLKLSGHEYESIRTAASSLGIEYDSPGIMGEIAVHFAFPKLKFAIAFASNSSINHRRRAEARRLGWNIVIIKPYMLADFTDEMITAQLRDFINTIKRNKS